MSRSRARGLVLAVYLAVLGYAVAANGMGGDAGPTRLLSSPQVPGTTTTTAAGSTVPPTTTATTATTEAPVTTAAPETTVRSGSGATTTVPVLSTVARPVSTTAPVGCHPSYQETCIPIGVADVDCANDNGDGPEYVFVEDFRVVGPDVYGLDPDRDGIACES